MSILADTCAGWVIDHWGAVEVKTGDESEQCGKVYKLNPDLFHILCPFKMDSQVKSTISQASTTETEKRRRKKKRKLPLNFGEERAQEYHDRVREVIQKAYTALLEEAKTKSYFLAPSLPRVPDNNSVARRAACIEGAGWSLLEMCHSGQVDSQGECPVKEVGADEDTIANIIWKNNKSVAMTTTMASNRYVIPARCTFLLSDIQILSRTHAVLGKYDLIVIDPPWENKSVKRQKKYSSLDNSALLDLPFGELMSQHCLVVVWVTNRHMHRQFLLEQFFPQHGIQYEATWTWIKVTKFGEFVYELDSPHKKPYETIMIGRYPQRTNGNCDNKTVIPTDKVILSVPCSLHSKKPPLKDVLSNYLPKEPRCLELFARNLSQNWTSWGNEVILHQHRDFYQEVT